MLGVECYSLPLQSVALRSQASAPISRPSAKPDTLPASLQPAAQLLESEVSLLTSERNQLCTQLCDLRTLLRKVTREMAAEARAEIQQLVIPKQTQLKAKAESQRRAMVTAEKVSGDLSQATALWRELGLS